MASVQLIITRVQTEIGNATGEPDSDWTDADYILAKLATLSDDIANRLELLDLNYATVEVILPAVPANTVDLSAFQASGQPLAMMILPKSIEWRLVGESEEDWSFAPQVDKVIDTDTGTGISPAVVASDDPTLESWEYRAGILKTSPSMEILDLRVRFVAAAISLTNNSQAQVAGLTNAYVYMACQHILEERASGVTVLSGTYEKRYNRACADFEGLALKSQVSKMSRFGGRRSGSNSGWDGGFRPPIVG